MGSRKGFQREGAGVGIGYGRLRGLHGRDRRGLVRCLDRSEHRDGRWGEN